MPDALELLKTRKSISASFLGPPVPSEAELAEIFAIASRVPDHGKLTPWRFIVFEDDGRVKASRALAALFKAQHPEATEKQLDEERRRLAQAPLVVAVVSKAAPHPKIPEWEQVLSAGNAAMNLVLAAGETRFVSEARGLRPEPGSRFAGNQVQENTVSLIGRA